MSNNIVQFNEEIIKGQIKELVRGSVEETLNELLEAEAQKLTQAARYERSEARQGYRSGHYDRNLTTTSGDVTLHVPRLKGISFETAIIERYRRRESSVEEALIEMYLAGVSVRRVEDITEALWGSKVSATTISELNKKAYQNQTTADAGHKRQAHPLPSIGHHPIWRMNMIQSNNRSFKNKPLSNIQQAQFSIGWRFCPVCGHKLYQKEESCSGTIRIKCLKCGNVATVDLAYRRR